MAIDKAPLLVVPNKADDSSRPALYETDASKYAGPHRWQTSVPARIARSLWRRRAYTRWFEQAITDIEIVGAHHLRTAAKQRGAVFVANHQSHLDTIIINEALPSAVRERIYYGAAQDRWFVKGKKKLTLKPWYQSLALGNFPIMRGGGSAALAYANELLTRKQFVMLFPEGTRATGESLGSFRHGATILALENDVPVCPIYLGGLRAIRAKKQRDVKPGPVYIEFLQPIHFSKGSNVAAATSLIEKRMLAVHDGFDLKLRTGQWRPRGVVRTEATSAAA